jgi:hypothetical protein
MTRHGPSLALREPRPQEIMGFPGSFAPPPREASGAFMKWLEGQGSCQSSSSQPPPSLSQDSPGGLIFTEILNSRSWSSSLALASHPSLTWGRYLPSLRFLSYLPNPQVASGGGGEGL